MSHAVAAAPNPLEMEEMEPSILLINTQLSIKTANDKSSILSQGQQHLLPKHAMAWHIMINNLLCLPVWGAKSSAIDMANDKKRSPFHWIHEEILNFFDQWSNAKCRLFLPGLQPVCVGTMVLLCKQALTLRETGRVTGGSVDKHPQETWNSTWMTGEHRLY